MDNLPESPSIPDLLKQYHAELLAGRGCSKNHSGEVCRYAGHLLAGMSLDTVDPQMVLQRLADMQLNGGISGRRCWAGNRGISIRARNKYLMAAQQFCRWLISRKLLADNPLANLRQLDPARDQRHPRRYLSAEELHRLVLAAHAGRTIQTIPGSARAYLYMVAAYTGLRKTELSTLTRDSFFLGDRPMVMVRAGCTKSKREAAVPLHRTVATYLERWLPTRPTQEPLWPIAHRRVTKCMQEDCRVAGIAYCDSQGRYADLHALRHWFITALALGGNHVQVTQRLARHSSPEVTLQYTHLPTRQDIFAISQLPDPPILPFPAVA